MRAVEFDRDAGVLRRHPLGPVGSGAAVPVRPGVLDPRLSGVGCTDLCDLRDGTDAVDRLAAGQAGFQPAALRKPISASTWCGSAKTPNRSRCCRASTPNASGCRSASDRVVANWYGIMSRTKRLTAFTASYSQAAVVFPFILTSPAYFADKIQLGALSQTAEAFGKRAGCALILRTDLPHHGGMARGRGASRRI